MEKRSDIPLASHPVVSIAALVALAVATLLLPMVQPAAGQATAPASLVGQVTDESGLVLPGATVTATSPALQVGEVTTVTNEQGEYRLSPLPIGTYDVEYSLAGFQTVRLEGVRLTVGFSAKLDQILRIGALEETITVSGVSPVVDVTSGATMTVLTRESVDLVPSARDGISSFLVQVPGVRTKFDIGGSSMTDTPVFRVYGLISQPWLMLEGVLMSDVRPGQSGSHWEFNSMEGARVQTVGSNAEMPRRGMLIDSTVKSGGNEFHGDMVGQWTNDSFQTTNIDDELRAAGVRGATELHARWDASGNLGGRIVRDKLWFYGSGRKRHDLQSILGAFHPDGTPATRLQDQGFFVAKGSYQANPSNRLIAFYHFAREDERVGATQFVHTESFRITHNKFKTRKIEWQSVPGNAISTSVQYGLFSWGGTYTGMTDKSATFDNVTQFVTGANVSDGQEQYHFRHHVKGSATIFRSDVLGGNHQIKAGFDFLHSGDNTRWSPRKSGDYRLIFSNGVPFQIDTWNHPNSPKSLDNWLGLYAQDDWTIKRRLSLNLGVRFDRDRAYIPAQCRPAGQFAPAECYAAVDMNVWNALHPRAHFSFDLLGTGTTAIKGGYGRYGHLREVLPEISSINLYNKITTTWRWQDRNGNRDYDPGEVNLDPNGPDFVSFGNLTVADVNPDELMPMTHELTISLEHQLAPSFGVRVGGIYTNNTNPQRFVNTRIPYEAYNIPITNLDPGPDGTLGSADDTGQSITYFDFPAELSGARFAQTMLINDPNANHSYKTIEVAATKRLSNRWQLSTSYSATKRHVPFGVADTYLAFNPNEEINTTDNTWEWYGKVSGAFLGPFGLMPSIDYSHWSGAPLARQVLFRGGRQVPTRVANVEPVGTIRLPATNVVNVRLQKRFVLGNRGGQLEMRIDIFNLLNANTVLGRNVRAGSSFMLPSSVSLPRVAQFGFQYTF